MFFEKKYFEILEKKENIFRKIFFLHFVVSKTVRTWNLLLHLGGVVLPIRRISLTDVSPALNEFEPINPSFYVLPKFYLVATLQMQLPILVVFCGKCTTGNRSLCHDQILQLFYLHSMDGLYWFASTFNKQQHVPYNEMPDYLDYVIE